MSEKDSRKNGGFGAVKWMFIFLTTLVIVGGGVFVYIKTIGIPGSIIDKGVNVIKELTTVEVRTFFSSEPAIMKGSQNLQIATLEQAETFSQNIEPGYFKKLPKVLVGSPSVEIKLPSVEYVYYVNVDGFSKWEFRLDEKENKLIISSPEIEFNRPAADISRMDVKIESSWFMIGEEDYADNLKKEIAGRLAKRAQENVNLIRALARENIKKFFEGIFLNKMYVAGDLIEKLKRVEFIVVFKDENKSEKLKLQ
jgi:hypothetical protein